MSKPYFSNNQADWTALEGVYINELVPPAAILGVNLNSVCVVAQTLRGPVNTPVLVDTPKRFVDVFGGRDMATNAGAVLNDGWKVFLNKPFGPSTYVVRAAAAAAVAASHTTSDGYLTVTASSVGAWGNNVTFQVLAATDTNVNHFNLTIVDYTGASITYQNLDISSTNDNTATVLGDDAANPVILTKVNPGTPVLQGPTHLTSGADGTIGDTDFTTSSGPLDTATNADGIGVIVCSRQTAATKAKCETNAGTVDDRLFLINQTNATDSVATSVSDVASFRSDRVIYCYNSPYTLDPVVGVQIQTHACDWMAAILSQTDVSVNPGSQGDTSVILQGITKLTSPAVSRGDLISMKNAGIACLTSSNGSFYFQSGISTYLADGTGKEQIDRRRETDYLQLSIADALQSFNKQKATPQRRQLMVSEITSFCQSVQGSIIAPDDPVTGKGFLVDNKSLNTAVSRGQGIENILLQVRLLNDLDYIVLTTSIGTEVTVSANV